ncbi:MAG: hypothetical protein JWP34_69 [Massilia sp.]|nr:hypothetical protein [Massilia sp.]
MIGGAGQSGNATLSASRGQLFRNSACTYPLSAPRVLVAGSIPGTWSDRARHRAPRPDLTAAGPAPSGQ